MRLSDALNSFYILHCREPIFAFVFEGAFLEFELTKPSFAPLFAEPPNNTARTSDQPYSLC